MDGTFLVITRNCHGWKDAVEILLRRADVGFSFCESVYDCLVRIYSVKNIESLCVVGDGEILLSDDGKFLEFCKKRKIKCIAINDGDLGLVKNCLGNTEVEPAEANHRISDEEIEALFSEKI